MKQKGFSPIFILVIIGVVIVAAVYFAGKMGISINFSKATPSPTTSQTTLSTATPLATPDETANWKTYTNTKYGFQIKYPDSFKALSDSENLYGWPDAAVLLYSGGQSYDLPIEVWNTEAEYKAKYPSGATVFKTSDGKYITLTNINNTPEVDKIIATFKFTR